MHSFRNTALATALLALLSACGGSETTTDAGSGRAMPPPTLTVQQSDLETPVIVGFPPFLAVTILVNGGAPNGGPVFLVASDAANVLKSKAVSAQSANTDSVFLTLRDNLGVGDYKGVVGVALCSTPACSVVYARTVVPYHLTLISGSNLTTLTPLAGISDWQTQRGDNAQDAYVPVTLDAKKFNVRWIREDGALPVTDAAKQLVVVLTDQGFGMAAYSDTDGTTLWHLQLGGESSGLALYNGVIYSVVEESLEARDDSTGALLFSEPLTDADFAGAPIVVGSIVYVNLTPDSFFIDQNILAFDATTGAPVWVGPSLGRVALPTSLAADSQDLYFYVPDELSPGKTGTPGMTALDLATGTLQWQIRRTADPSISAFGNGQKVNLFGATVALDGSGGAVELVAADSDVASVERYDLTTHKRLWATGFPQFGTFYGSSVVAVGNGDIYAGVGPKGSGKPASVNALSLNTGKVLWTWTTPTADFGVNCLLVTNNILFVGTEDFVYAVDLNTRAILATFPFPGDNLSLSPSGILYVGTTGLKSTYNTVAINLD
jgi:hypothetical protein